jgi:LysM repeat protein
MAAPLIPIIMTGARVVIRKAPDIARALIKEGKARYAKYVSRDIDEAVTKFAGKGKGAPKLPTLASTARKKAAAEAAKKKAARMPDKELAKAVKRTDKAAGVVAGVVGAASLLDPLIGGTKSVTVKAGDTLSQIAKDNNTTVAAIKKANPSITNIHLISPGQEIKVPKVKGRKSVYQGMTAAELQQPKKTTTAAKIKYGPGGYGASKTGGIVKRSAGGKVKKYTGGGTLKSTKQMTMVAIKPPPIKKSNPWGAAIKGKGKGYK